MDIFVGLIVFINSINWNESFILQSRTNSDYVFIVDHSGCYVNGSKAERCEEMIPNLANFDYPDIKFAKLNDPYHFQKWSKLPIKRKHVIVYFENYQECSPMEKPCDIATVMVCDRNGESIVIRSLAKDAMTPYRDIVKLRRTIVNKETKIFKNLDNPYNLVKSPGPSPITSTLLGTSNKHLFYTIFFSNDSNKRR